MANNSSLNTMDEKLVDKINKIPQKDKATAKGLEIAKIGSIAKTNVLGLEVKVISITPIPNGVECLIQAWENGEQVAFGFDGTIDIERVRIFNPPILASDGTKSLKKFFNKAEGKEEYKMMDNFVEDPKLALLQSLAHTVSVIKKPNTNMIVGKVGNTTSTFYPQAGTGGTTCDGEVSQTGLNDTFTNIRNAAGNGVDASGAQGVVAGIDATTTSNQYSNLWRSIYTLDTSALPDADTISAAVFSLYDSNSQQQNFTPTATYVTVASTPAANNTLANGDYAQLGSTAYSDYKTFTVSQYNDMTFNATGIAAISKTGITKLGVRTNWDADNSAPTWGSGYRSYRYVQMADTSGTTQDPKLVVTHAAASGPANLKSRSGNLTANIKSVSGNLIANVKSLSGNA